MRPTLSQSMPAMNARSAGTEVPSPCVNVCAIDPDKGICVGCFRTLDEIAAWVQLDTPRRLAVWAAIAERRKAADADR